MSRSPTFDVVVAGAAYRDVIRNGQDKQECQGGITYACCALGKLGANTAAFGCIATGDPELTRAAFEAVNVDHSFCTISDAGACVFDVHGGDEFVDSHVAQWGPKPGDLNLPLPAKLPPCKSVLVYPLALAWAYELLQVGKRA